MLVRSAASRRAPLSPDSCRPGKADGRTQRALHEALRRGLIAEGAGLGVRAWRPLTLAAERTVLASEFPEDASALGWPDMTAATPPSIAVRSPPRLAASSRSDGILQDPRAYEQAMLAADYHDGRRTARRDAAGEAVAEDLLAAIVAGTYVGEYADERDAAHRLPRGPDRARRLRAADRTALRGGPAALRRRRARTSTIISAPAP